MKAVLLLVLLVFPGQPGFSQLFPEREAQIGRLNLLLKRIDLKNPALVQVRFLWADGNAGSALLEMCAVASGEELFNICSNLKPELQLKEEFRAWRQAGRPGFFSSALLGGEPDVLLLQVLNICSMRSALESNTLSSGEALEFWELFIKLSDQTWKRRGGTPEDCAVLALGARLDFIRSAAKWRARAKRLIKRGDFPGKIPEDAASILTTFRKLERM